MATRSEHLKEIASCALLAASVGNRTEDSLAEDAFEDTEARDDYEATAVLLKRIRDKNPGLDLEHACFDTAVMSVARYLGKLDY